MENIKLFCVSLGCDKNLVDTEKMLGLLNGRGITFTDDETEADVILVKMCIRDRGIRGARRAGDSGNQAGRPELMNR